MARGRPRDSRKEHLWQQRIQLWQDSGLTARDFCERHGIPLAPFYSWRRRLQHRLAPPVPLVPVQLLPDPFHGPAPCLEVVLANGRTLRVPDAFDEAALRRLLAILEESAPC